MKKTICALALVGAAMPGAALAQDSYEEESREYAAPADAKAGFRIEGRAFWENITDPEFDGELVYEFGNGVGAGVEFGADFAVGNNILVGPYATFDFSSTETCEIDLCFATPDYWAAGLQVGITTGTRGMIYGKLGYGEQTATLIGEFDDPDLGLVVLDESETGGGYNFALGYEHGFNDTLYVRGEVGASESYDIYGFDLQRGYLGLSLGARF